MTDEEVRTLAFFCPDCLQSVILSRSVFQLCAGKNTLPCPCGKSTLTVVPQEERFSLEVPCRFCKKNHAVSCRRVPFLREKTLAFSCAASGLDCCYVGEEAPVFAAMACLEEAMDLLSLPKEETSVFLHPEVMEEVLGELRDRARAGEIVCPCGRGDFQIQVRYAAVLLQCAACGASLRVPAATQEDLESLCCQHRLLLRRAGEENEG